MKAWVIGLVVLCWSAPSRGQVAPPPDFDRDVRSILDGHCVRCHGESLQKGGLRVDTLTRDFAEPRTAGLWTEIMDRMNSGEMPPSKEPRLDPARVARAADWIAGQLSEAEAARQSAIGEKVSFRRLSREEYRQTIRDLLGVTFDAEDPAGLPDDPDWQGFERIGSVLSLSASHVEKYLAAAETVLDEALRPLGPPRREVVRWSAVDMRVRGDVGRDLEARGLLERVRADIVPNNGALDARDLTIATAGEYRVRVKLSGLRAQGGRAARLRIYATDLGRLLFEQDVEAPEDEPVTLEFRAHLPVGTHLIRLVNAVPGPNPEERASRPLNTKPFLRMKARLPWQIKLTDEEYKPIWPTVLLDYVEWDGPIVEAWPTPEYKRIFLTDRPGAPDVARAREILSRFATRAYRRPVHLDELDRLVRLFERSRQLGDDFEGAVRTGLVAVLCSQSFLYLVEGSTGSASTTLGEYELASRLSYFLWGSMPDARLLELALEGKLHDPATLKEEARRMLRDERSKAFADSFPRQWLQLRRVGMFQPDKKIYPEYDDFLEQSMVAETVGFFAEVLHRNLSIREFLDSDWTMLNEILAQHYGIAGVRGDGMRRVELDSNSRRGGLLTQASILGLTSDGTRHRPVHRGKWVLESILGNPPPPPPPNVSAITPTPAGRPKTSLRAKIEAHRDDANCASCHRKIDPLGLAFEQFDAIGRWRVEEAVRDGSGDNPRLDPSGELPDGRKFADAEGLKTLMVADLDKFAAAFLAKLATYALRRGMTFDDRKSLQQIAERCQGDRYPLETLIENLVASDLFRKR